MCGIYGSTKIFDVKTVQEKLQSISYRGPDYSGYKFIDEKVVFGHNRLAIIDLDSRSNQPFSYQGVDIVFNGEVYNFLDIKKELSLTGYEFHTTSDTEVICAAYLHYGADCVKHFNGMFAFVIYDKKNNILFGARDRLGKKPFYYYQNGNHFEFASQLSAIEVGNKLTVSQDAIGRYLMWNYVPDPYSIYEKVYKLHAGHYFIYNFGNADLKTAQYWDLPEYEVKYTNYNEAKDVLKEMLTDAVRIRQIADVPLGVFLSGGVDSSLVTAIAQSNSMSPVKTFSIKFNEAGFDESIYAKQVADHLHTDHTEILCDYKEGINFMTHFSDYYDEPFADSSAIPSLLLSKYTKKSVTVALTGDGGDESFLGYNVYDRVHRFKQVFDIPYILRRPVGYLLEQIPFGQFNLMGQALKLKTVNDFHVPYFSKLNRKWLKYSESDPVYMEYLFNNRRPLFERISDFDTKTYLNGDINTKVDRASMAFSLETRAPLMDYRVIEFVRNIPTEFKFDGKIKKKILKDVLYDYVPKHIFDRKKAGFGVPIEEWFRNELKDFVYDSLDKTRIEELQIIDYKRLMTLVNEHMKEQRKHTPIIWSVIVLLNWLKSRQNG